MTVIIISYPNNQDCHTCTQISAHTYVDTLTFCIAAHSCREFLLIESAIVPELINSVWLSCCRGGSHYHHISLCMQNLVVKNTSRCSLCDCNVDKLNSHLHPKSYWKRSDVNAGVNHEDTWWIGIKPQFFLSYLYVSFHIYYFDSRER